MVNTGMNRGPKPAQSESSMSFCWNNQERGNITICKCMAGPELHEICLKMKLAEKKAERRTGESQRGRERGKTETKSSSCHSSVLIQPFLIPIMQTAADLVAIKSVLCVV